MNTKTNIRYIDYNTESLVKRKTQYLFTNKSGFALKNGG